MVLVVSVIGMLSACGASQHEAKQQPLKLHIWYDDTGSFQPPQMIQGSVKYTKGSDADLPAIVYACGVREFESDALGGGGMAVSLSSSSQDQKIVRCVQKSAWFGFNAARALERPDLGYLVNPKQAVLP